MTQAVGQSAGPDPAPDRDWLERYEPLRPLGKAYWTRSLLCRDRQSGSQVVVREIRPAIWWHAAERLRALGALRREAEALQRLGQTPGGAVFPALLEAVVDGEMPWIATEFLPGVTLRDRFPLGPDGRIRSESGFTLPQTLYAISSLCDGLRILHHLGFVHGLIHPGCLVLAETEEVAAGSGPRLRLRSLGWAAAPDGQTAVADREAFPYVDPYGLRNTGPPGPEADAWSLAAVLFELATGSPPFALNETQFGHEERFAHFREAVHGPPRALLSGLHPEVVALLGRAFSRPAGTPPDAGTGPRIVEDLFSGLAACQAVAQGDPFWSQARLPNPDLQRQRREIPSRKPPISPRLLDQHDMVWEKWRSTTRQAIEGFSRLENLASSEPWSAWRREIDEDAATCIQTEPADDPQRHESDALAARVQQIERRIASLGQICADAWQLLREPLREVAEELEAAVGQAGGALQRNDPALVEEIGAFRREIERLSTDGVTPDLFPVAARLSIEGEELRQRTHRVSARLSEGEVLHRRQAAQVAFWQAVRSRDFEKGRSVLQTWPGGADDTGRRLAEGLDSWQTMEQEAGALLAAPRTPQAVASMRQLARTLGTEPPAGFETLARPLVRQLEERLEAPRTAARAAVERARAFCAEQQESAARAAERSQIESLPDRKAASTFCRALQTLERAVEDATRRLSTATEDADVLMGLPAKLRELENDARQARQTWWPGENLPWPQSEWTSFVEKINGLVARGRSGIQQAHSLRETRVPAGWEEAARRLVLPPIPPADRRKWLTLAAAATVVVGIGVLWIFWESKPTPPKVPSQVKPEPTTDVVVTAPTPSPEVPPTAEEAWLHGPASATLHLQADGAERDQSFPLPAVVRFPGKTQVTLWLTSGQQQTGKTQAAGERGALQQGVDQLARELADDPSHVQAIDADVALRVAELLKGGQP